MDSYRFYLAARVWYAVCWTTMITVSLVFMVEVAGLDPLQMVLVGTVLELSVFLFEVPTGVVADAVSRRLSVIIGHALLGAGFGAMVFWPVFPVILLCQVVWGFGWTFISGAYPAWLTSEVGVGRANEAFLRGAQLGHVGAFVGIGIAIALAHVSLALPIVAGASGIVLLAVAMALFMREDHFEPAAGDERASWGAMGRVLAAGVSEVRGHRLLLLMIAVTATFGAFSEGVDRLFTPFLIERFEFPPLGALDTVAWWGVIAAVSSAAGLAATTIARRRLDLGRQRRLTGVLAACLGGISVAVLLMASVPGFYAVLGCFWLVGALRSVYDPLMTAWLNRLLPESSRATLFSLFGQSDAVGQVVGGPMLGYAARAFGISTALAAAAVALLPALPLYHRMSRVLEPDREGEG
ncbi:MAG: MFS transporter [Pseudomonadales bacterium]